MAWRNRRTGWSWWGLRRRMEGSTPQGRGCDSEQVSDRQSRKYCVGRTNITQKQRFCPASRAQKRTLTMDKLIRCVLEHCSVETWNQRAGAVHRTRHGCRGIQRSISVLHKVRYTQRVVHIDAQRFADKMRIAGCGDESQNKRYGRAKQWPLREVILQSSCI